MPNPRSPGASHLDQPLDEYLGYATHVVIACRCFHQTIMMTEELYRLSPGAVTYADFKARLKCRRCGLKGWATISAAGR